MSHPTIIQKTPHQDDCIALERVQDGDWETPWFLSGDRNYKYDAAGRRMGDREGNGPGWIVAPCNDPDCPAVLLVDQDWLDELLHETEKEKHFDQEGTT